MKRFQTLVLVLLIVTNGFSQPGIKEKNCEVISMGQFRELNDFNDIINKLKAEDRLTISNASTVKLFSSDLFTAIEQTPDSIVSQHGKIDTDDIKLIFQVAVHNIEYLVIITSYSSFGHAFKYDLSQKKLERLRNNGHIILTSAEALKVKECDDSTITLFIKSSPQEAEKWINYYSLDLNNNTITNTKNCRITDAGEECKEMRKIEFIRVYSSGTLTRPPFEKKETEISNNRICYRNVLPPRQQMRESFLEAYDSCDTIPKYREIDKVDYDSIVNYILTSGLLDIDLNYTKPNISDGVVGMTMGGSYRYVIETSDGEMDLLISGGMIFTLPEILAKFDRLFTRILSRYNKNE